MYHLEKGTVTIQFPELKIVLDYSQLQNDSSSSTYPKITVFSKLSQGEIEKHLCSFTRIATLDECLDAICVDDWDTEQWLDTVTDQDKLEGRSFRTTFVNLTSLVRLLSGESGE